MSVGILTDLTKCIGCEACVWACKEINGLSQEGRAKRLSSTTWTTIERNQGVNIRRQCMHCVEPACASVCPVTALEKTKTGPVIYHEDRCIGCRYCVMACPFEIPKYEWDSVLPKVQKCIMCYEKRVSKGRQPACTEVCPTGATMFGDRDKLLDLARHRMEKHPDRYVDHIYGFQEAGGTSVLYLSDVPFEKLGFKAARTDVAYPKLTWRVLSQIPNVVSVGGVLMVGIWWIINRREKLEKVRNGEMTEEEAFGEERSDNKET
ncbi:4Fe-4S dicluster domain-containing protein [candidate division KSB1 bacterium]|nr:4Fe-4S dicluster domain-containing protein [candidate division KSB1 bacterium]NIR72028.1 4Fe-4S dicluster domain-containing protein [candidate division KSB1 bacterium]NIS25969.1 4Fe-4S dicluster domain-containing protein [candidate division KSB1 bacterium]NIT74940.1 4Fe-4S dicluster domain-containing protein [candidate division KSB1 bacterium]NIU28724.1 4Fe-4S dicluster domain-containing protein [candidate division KSB1 bacterium]